VERDRWTIFMKVICCVHIGREVYVLRTCGSCDGLWVFRDPATDSCLRTCSGQLCQSETGAFSDTAWPESHLETGSFEDAFGLLQKSQKPSLPNHSCLVLR
jgi:hypothetical protein